MPNAIRLSLFVLACAALAFWCSGCGDASGKSSQPEAAEKKNEAEPEKKKKAEDLIEKMAKAAAMETMVTSTAGNRKTFYQHEEEFPKGKLIGACMLAEGEYHPPDANAITVTSLKDPQPKEQHYYEERYKPKREPDLQVDFKKRTLIPNVLVRVKGIQRGRRPLLDTPELRVWNGLLSPSAGSAGPKHRIALALEDDVMLLKNYDPFPLDLHVQHVSGEEKRFEAKVEACEIKWTNGGNEFTPWNKDTTIAWTRNGFLGKAAPVRTPPLRPVGVYEVVCRRHPWMRTYVLVNDNPYVAVTDPSGRFSFDDLPPGTHELEVWHPDLKPVESGFTVEIKADGSAELGIGMQPR